MASFRSNTASPTQDTGWGLIFRLNDLLREVESFAFKGEYDKWNYKLDRIWANLTYREEFDIQYDNNKKIIGLELKKTDYEVKFYLDKQISSAKKKMRLAKKESLKKGEDVSKNRDYFIAKNELYSKLQLKDIWIRKMMHKNKLYIKEIKHNPAGAMFGGE